MGSSRAAAGVDETPDAELGRLASVDLNLLVPLLALLEERSVTRAAATVGLSQPAMSHALRRMRRLLGDELIVRRGNGMILTPRAVGLVPPLRRLLNQTARLVSSTPFDPATDRRVITMAMTASTAIVIGSTIARLIAERAPHVVLRLRTMTLASVEEFTDGRADVLLLAEGFDLPYPRERLYDDRYVVIAGPSAPPDAGAAELLATLPHVVFDAPQYHARPYEILNERRVPYTVRTRVSDNLLIPQLVAHAGGVAIHRSRISTALSRELDLRIEDFPYPVPRFGIDMMLNPWLADDGFTGWLRQVLVDAAGTL